MTRETVKLSIIVPAYNVADYITEAVNSALSQRIDALDVIVVDDGSSDDTAERVRAIQDSRLRLIQQANRGLSAARNTGLRAARGEYVGFLDGDDVWCPTKGPSHVAVLDADPAVGVVYSDFAYIDEHGTPTGQILVTGRGDPSLADLIVRNSVSSAVVMRRSLFDQAGLFDENLRACEDWEMWVRLKSRTGTRFTCVPEVLAAYRVRGDSLTMDFDHQVMSARRAIEKLREVVPDAPETLWRRSLAEVYRISARKALSAGDSHEAARLLTHALSEDPWVWARTLRGVGTFALGAVEKRLPKSVEGVVYRTVRRAMKAYFAVRHRTSGWIGSPQAGAK